MFPSLEFLLTSALSHRSLMCLDPSQISQDSDPPLCNVNSTTFSCNSIGSFSNGKGPFRTKTGIASAAVVPPQPVLNLNTESLGGAGAPRRGSSSFTGLFHPASSILTSSGFSGLFLLRLPQPLCFFLGVGAGGGGGIGGAGGVGGAGRDLFFFFDRFFEGHISASGSNLGPFVEGTYGVDLNHWYGCLRKLFIGSMVMC